MRKHSSYNLNDENMKDVVVMSHHDFKIIERQYKEFEAKQKKCWYKTKKCLSTSILTRFICKCLKVKDNLN